MDELIEVLTTKVGIDRDVAEKTIGVILGFLRNEGPADDVNALIASIPGAENAVVDNESGGGVGGLMGGGLMALGGKLMALGLGMGEIQSVSKELFRYGRTRIGSERIDAIVAGTPGLNQFA